MKYRKINPSICLIRTSSLLSKLLSDLRPWLIDSSGLFVCHCSSESLCSSACLSAFLSSGRSGLSVCLSESVSLPALIVFYSTRIFVVVVVVVVYNCSCWSICLVLSFFVYSWLFLHRLRKTGSIACTQCLKRLATPFSSTLGKW